MLSEGLNKLFVYICDTLQNIVTDNKLVTMKENHYIEVFFSLHTKLENKIISFFKLISLKISPMSL